MKFLHAREYVAGTQYIRVDSDTQCNVILTDDANFQAYQRGETFRYFGGGFFKEFPAILVPPYPGNWNVTIDLGGGSANIRYSITVAAISGG
jgi:hypothetical protein